MFTFIPLLLGTGTVLMYCSRAPFYIELVVEVVVGAGDFVEKWFILSADASFSFSTLMWRIRE
jgi:hypothetical protein